MNRRQALSRACVILADAAIEDALLEAEILLRHVLGIDRTQLYSDLDADIAAAQEKDLDALLERRCNGEPAAYITGHREFFGLDFIVNRHVLIPRPESELLVETAIAIAGEGGIKSIADIGTGCGVLAVSLAVNLCGVEILATDISKEALAVAAVNCKKHGVENRVWLLHGNMLEPLEKPADLIIANLPYVRNPDVVAIVPEPALALDGGYDGTEVILRFCSGLGEKLQKGGTALLEIGEGQAAVVVSRLKSLYPSAEIQVAKDLAGIERMVSLRLTENRA